MKQSIRYLLLLLLAVVLVPARTVSPQVNDQRADEALRRKAVTRVACRADRVTSVW